MLRKIRDAVPTVDAAAEERALARLRAHARHSPSRRRGWTAAAAIAAVLVILVVAQLLLPPQAGGPSSASAALHRLADSASERAALSLDSSHDLYTRTRDRQFDRGSSLTGERWTYVIDVEVETWLAADGSGRIVRTYGEASFLSPAGEAAWRAAGSPAIPPSPVTDERFDPGELPGADLAALPTDPAALKAVLDAREVTPGPPGDAATLNIIGQLLARPDATPELRAALFEVAASLPGVESAGQVADPSGRMGMGFRVADGARTTTLIVDDSTTVLATVIDPSSGSDRLETYVAYLESSVVPSTSGA